YLFGVLTRCLRQLSTTQHSRHFFRTLFACDRSNRCPRAPASSFLFDQIMMIRKGGNLREVSNAEQLIRPRKGLEFLPHSFCRASTNTSVNFIKHKGLL